MLRRFSACLAFATCCFLVMWVELVSGRRLYLARRNPLDTMVIPALCGEALVAAALFAAWELCRRKGWHKALSVHALFLAGCVAPLGFVLVAIVRLLGINPVPLLHRPLVWVVGFPLAMALLAAAIRAPRAASRRLLTAFRWALPVLIVVTLWSTCVTLRYPSALYQDGALAPPLPEAAGLPAPSPRVVWVIFDELSEAIAFEHRPASLELPNLDRLRAESFYATGARPPFDQTIVSLPALILGTPVEEAGPQGPRNLLVRVDGRLQPLAGLPNVFDAARGLGFNTAVAGWYHPYGRLLNRSLTRCYWVSMGRLLEDRFQAESLPRAIWNRWSAQVEGLPLIGRLPGINPLGRRRMERIRRFLFLKDRALELAADGSLGLALLHLPVPHSPNVYSRAKGALATEGALSYLDSVALADRTLGELRAAIERAGLWNRTALVVSADHGWRTEQWRGGPDWTAEDEAFSHLDTSGIPFLLHLAGQTAPVRYEKGFNTVITRRILTAILARRLRNAGEVAEEIEAAENVSAGRMPGKRNSP